MATQKVMRRNEFLAEYTKLCEKHGMVLDAAHPLYIVVPKNLCKPRKFNAFIEFITSNTTYIGDGYAYIRRQWGIR